MERSASRITASSDPLHDKLEGLKSRVSKRAESPVHDSQPKKVSLLEALVLEIFSPGTNKVSIKTLYFTLGALLVSLLLTLWIGIYSLHLLVLLALAVGLLLSVLLFDKNLNSQPSS